MPPKPVLLFPAARVAARATLQQVPPPSRRHPSRASQGVRLGPRFTALEQQFGTVQATVDGIDPEQVIVFETVGSVADFQAVVRHLPGLEWLGDFDVDVETPDPGFLLDGTVPNAIRGHLFLTVGNQTAYRQLLQQWDAWTASPNGKLARGFGALALVFEQLQDVRAWGVQDRVRTTGIVEYWEQSLTHQAPFIHFDVELWSRDSPEQRTLALIRVRDAVIEAGGRILSETAIPDIDYLAALVELPADVVKATLDALQQQSATRLLRLSDVKYVTPSAALRIPSRDASVAAGQMDWGALPTKPPVVALLDGLPLANHLALQGRLVIDDPDDFAARYNAGEHDHGTAMASLILHGELGTGGGSVQHQLYVRPVMVPGQEDFHGVRRERFPTGVLLVDLIHRAVRRLYEADGDTPPQAPTVRVVNVSLGDARRLFDREVSPWARLLDWLAWKYRILFVVSAGNHSDELVIDLSEERFARLDDATLRSHTLRALMNQRATRRLLSPAEAVNVLTVGALHGQSTPVGATGNLSDLFRGSNLPSPMGSIASGFRRALKPELLVYGGAQHYSRRIGIGDSSRFQLPSIANQPGQLTAAPGGTSVPPQNTARKCGSSNSAALTSRAAHNFFEEIVALRSTPGGDQLGDEQLAVLLKAMLVHGAEWGKAAEFITDVFGIGIADHLQRWRVTKRACAQLLGYGVPDFDRALTCSDQRVVVIGTSQLGADEGHVYQLPLPTALSATVVKRRLTATLAWLTPFNYRHRNYAKADLWFEFETDALQLKRVDADHAAVRRGTIQHELMEGEAAVPIAAGEYLDVTVSCRPDAGRLREKIPYALVVSLEVARPLGVDIHEQVRVALDQLRATVPVRPVGS